MIRTLALLALVVLSGLSLRTYAMPVELNGLEWQQPDDFSGSTWNDVSAICDHITGVCNGNLNGIDLTGWVWAGVDDMNDLFNAYFGNRYNCCAVWEDLGPGPDGLLGLDARGWGSRWTREFSPTHYEFFIDIFGLPMDLITVWSGWVRGEVPGANDRGYVALIRLLNVYSPANDDAIVSGSQRSRTIGDEGSGAWFFREPTTGIPSPATGGLIIIGLLGLRFGRRNSNRKTVG